MDGVSHLGWWLDCNHIGMSQKPLEPPGWNPVETHPQPTQQPTKPWIEKRSKLGNIWKYEVRRPSLIYINLLYNILESLFYLWGRWKLFIWGWTMWNSRRCKNCACLSRFSRPPSRKFFGLSNSNHPRFQQACTIINSTYIISMYIYII